MKSLKLFFGILLTSQGISAYAQNENLVIVPRTETILEDSSTHNRMGKNFTLTAQLLGTSGGLSTNGLAFGKYLNRSSLLVLEVLSGTDRSRYNSSIFTDTSSTYDINGGIVGLYLKNFEGNSFYYKIGAESRRVSYDYRYVSSATSSFQRKFEGTSFSAAVVIGNQWQWKSFTLGCDWVGLSLPLSHNIFNEYLSDNTSYEKTRMAEVEDHYIRGVAVQGLHFYLGASF